MSGFSLPWLDLRAPADARACSAGLVAVAVNWAIDAERRLGRPLRIVDLASGSGNMLMYLAGRLPVRQRWRLIDNDERLLATAAARWQTRGGALADSIPVTTEVADLAHAPLAAIVADADLVTASALLDLVSDSWCRRLADAFAAPGRGLLALLSYDGEIEWSEADAFDALVRRLFNRHQQTDKGFGPALGPKAAPTMLRILAEAGARVHMAPSPWRLDAGDIELQMELLAGWADAATEVAPESADSIAAWRQRRIDRLHRRAGAVTVGHRDVFASW